MERLSIGSIDCGSISPAYLPLASAFRGLDVRAVAVLNLAAAQARADEFGTKAQSVEDLLANPAVDVVINLTIPDAHFVVSKAILQAGKHAYSGKTPHPQLRAGGTARSGPVDLAGRDGKSATVAAWDHPFGRNNAHHSSIGDHANDRSAGLADMVAALRDGRDARCSIDGALHGAELTTACLALGEERRFIHMQTTCTRLAALDRADAPCWPDRFPPSFLRKYPTGVWGV
jgi:hypothetical protein